MFVSISSLLKSRLAFTNHEREFSDISRHSIDNFRCCSICVIGIERIRYVLAAHAINLVYIKGARAVG